MASETQFQEPAGTVVERGESVINVERTLETATSVYPGAECAQGTDEQDIIVNSGIKLPIGYAAYELTSPTFRKDETSTIYTILDKVVLSKGGGHVYTGKLAAYTKALQGDLLANWGSGALIPVAIINGQICIKVPFSEATSQTDTGIDLVAGMIVKDVYVYADTVTSTGTIDIGIGMGSETGYDADGFLDGGAISATTWVTQDMINTTSTSLTAGVLLYERVSYEATTGVCTFPINPGYVVSTAVSLDYTTSSCNASGYFYLAVSHPHMHILGKAVKAKDNSAGTSTANVLVQRVF